MWPFDPKTTGLPTTHKPTGAYIMWAGSPMPTCMLWGVPDGSKAAMKTIEAFGNPAEVVKAVDVPDPGAPAASVG